MKSQTNSLMEQIERAVLKATHGRVGTLDIEDYEGQIVMRGRCTSFTCKELAQDAVLPIIGEMRLVNAIEVG